MSFKKELLEFSALKKEILQKNNENSVRYKDLVMKIIPEYFASLVDENEFVVRPSTGVGNFADVPWICVLSKNSRISPGPQKGIYITLLFAKEGDYSYLTLMQGITNFKELNKNNVERKRMIAETVNYFRTEVGSELIDAHNFSVNKINLGEGITALAKGYEQTTIISKRFDHHDFNEKDFYESLDALLSEYKEIVKHIGEKSYDDVIQLINGSEDVIPVDDALEEIEKTIDPTTPRDVAVIPIRVKKGEQRSNRFAKISQPRVYKKTDYIKKAEEQHKNGLIGEKLALTLERERIVKLGLDPNAHVKWISEIEDGHGYDIESVDYHNGKLVKIFIEVKATKDQNDTEFFISKNELNVSKTKQLLYRLFRIFDLNSTRPKYYMADGEIEENFYLDPVTFTARYKFNVEI